MEWEKVEPEYNKSWDFKSVPEFIGEFIGMKTEVGANKSNLYTFKSGEKAIDVWGSTVLDPRLAGLKPGQMVKIEYKGMEAGQGGREYHNFEVYKSK